MNTQKFLDEKLEGLLNGLVSAKVVATTKNQVGGMYGLTGQVTCPEGLSVHIFNGHDSVPREFQRAIFTAFAVGTEPFTLDRIEAVDKSDDRIAAFQNGRTFYAAKKALEDPTGGEIFLISYVSYHGLEDCVQSLRMIKRSFPGLRVIATACDCNENGKRYLFEPLIESGEVVDLIIEPTCGGIQSMQMLLDGFIEKWPNRSLA